jgi:hypothetical protein
MTPEILTLIWLLVSSPTPTRKYLEAEVNYWTEQDEAEAIDKNNVVQGGRTRGAKPTGSYHEPSDEVGLPGPEDGTSSTR